MLSSDRAVAMLFGIETDPAEWCRHRLSLLMFCKFKYFCQGIGNPGNDGNIGPQQDYQEMTDSLHCHLLSYMQILQMLTRKSELQAEAPIPAKCLNSIDFHRD